MLLLIVTWTRPRSSLNNSKWYIKQCKNNLKRLKASTQKGTTRIVEITSSNSVISGSRLERWGKYTLTYWTIESDILGSKRLPVGRSDQVLKIRLKNQSVRILINLASNRRARHFESNSVNKTKIPARMQKLDPVKVRVWLSHMVGLDDMEKVPTNGEAPSGRLSLAPAYCISEQKVGRR